MTIERGSPLYPRNSTTVDTGGAIDIRSLEASNGGTNDATQLITATHTQDNVGFTFDPATTVSASTTPENLQKIGWALPLASMTPADDTRCNCILDTGTVTVNVDMTVTAAGGTGNLGGTIAPLVTCSLFRYNPSTDTGTRIGFGQSSATTWSTVAVTGDQGTFKTVTVTISVASVTEFLQGEVLLLQVGLYTGTLPNPVAGTTTYTFTMRVDDTNTKITWATGQSIKQLCREAQAATGVGAQGQQLLSEDESKFETSSASWIGVNNATVARSTAQAYTGSASLSITKTVAVGNANATSPGKSCPPGQVIYGAAYIRAATAVRGCACVLTFRNSSNGTVGQFFGPTVNDSTTGWTLLEVSGLAPAGTDNVLVSVVIVSAAVGEVHYIDAAMLIVKGWNVRVRATRQATGVGVGSSTRRVRATRQATGVGVAARALVRVRATRLATGVGVGSRTARVRATRTATGVGTGARAARVRATRQATGVGVASFSRREVLARSAQAVAVGEASRTLRGRATRAASGVGEPSFDRSLVLFREDTAVAVGEASRSPVRARVTRSADGVGVASFTRALVLARSAQAVAVGEASFTRSIIFVRQALATAVGRVTGRIELDIDELPNPEGGTVIVKKIFPVFD